MLMKLKSNLPDPNDSTQLLLPVPEHSLVCQHLSTISLSVEVPLLPFTQEKESLLLVVSTNGKAYFASLF